MRFLSAETDFNTRTLAGIRGCLQRLDFLVSLRNENGGLSHWGLERTYGAEVARGAVNKAYAAELQEMLRISVRQLWDEARSFCEGNGEPNTDFLPRLRDVIRSTPNERLREPQMRHLNSVLDALWELAVNRQPSRDA